MAVGAHEDGGKVYVFKSRPVISLNVQQTVDESHIPPEVKYATCMDPDNKMGYFCLLLKVLPHLYGVI